MTIIEDILEECRVSVRASGFKLTPYRLGLEVGRRGFDLPCPYGGRGREAYREGVNFGLQHQPELSQ